MPELGISESQADTSAADYQDQIQLLRRELSEARENYRLANQRIIELLSDKILLETQVRWARALHANGWRLEQVDWGNSKVIVVFGPDKERIAEGATHDAAITAALKTLGG